MATISNLVVKLSAESVQLVRELQKSGRRTDGWSRKVRKSVNAAAKSFIVLGTAAAASLTAIVASASKTIDAQAKLADQIGISTESLAAFNHLGELNGVTNEKMRSSLERMGKRVGEAALGFGAAHRELNRLNINAKELAVQAPEKQYAILAERIRGMSSASERAASIAAIFGREGLALQNVVNKGAEAFEVAKKEAIAYGIAISRVDAAKVEASNDAFTRLQAVMKGVANTITIQLAPFLKVISDRFTKAAVDAGGFKNEIVSAMDTAITVVGFAADAFRGLQVVWKVLEVAFKSLVALWISEIALLDQGVTTFLNLLPGITATTNTALQDMAVATRGVLGETVDELNELLLRPMPSEGFKQFSEEVKAEAQTMGEAVSAGLSGQGNEETVAIQEESFNAREAALKMHHDRLKKIEIDSALKRLEFEKLTASQKTKHVIGELKSLTQGVATQSKAMFKINKVAGIANAIINTSEGVTEALAAYPPPLSFVMAAAQLAAGLAQVNAIKSQSFSGGGTPSTSGGFTGGGTGGTPSLPEGPAVGLPDAPGTQDRAGGAGTLTVIITGNVTSDEFIEETVGPKLRELIGDRDFELIPTDSRNAANILAGTT